MKPRHWLLPVAVGSLAMAVLAYGLGLPSAGNPPTFSLPVSSECPQATPVPTEPGPSAATPTPPPFPTFVPPTTIPPTPVMPRPGERLGIGGPIIRVEGDRLTVAAGPGEVTIVVGPGTSIHCLRPAPASRRDLQVGQQVAFWGETLENGSRRTHGVLIGSRELVPYIYTYGSTGVWFAGGRIVRLENDRMIVTGDRGENTVPLGLNTRFFKVVRVGKEALAPGAWLGFQAKWREDRVFTPSLVVVGP